VPHLVAAPRASAAARPLPEPSAESVRVVFLTRSGEIALAVDRRAGLAPSVRLPGLAAARATDSEEILRRRLRDEAGLEAGELQVMSRYGIPTGDRGNAAILLAPAAARRPGRGLAYVPLERLSEFLAERRAQGWRVDLLVRVGLRLAERHFGRWARVRLRGIVEGLRARGGSPRGGTGRVLPLRRRPSSRG